VITPRIVAVLVLPLLLDGCVRASVRRIHAENMSKAEDFRRDFEKQLPPGTPLADVDAYLRSRKLDRSLLGMDGTGEITVELFREEWPSWYCGKGSVGLIVRFTSNRLVGVKAGGWSNDCP